MLAGFLGCFLLRLYSSLAGITLPVYLDPSVVGIVCNVIAVVIGTVVTKVADEEVEAREALFVIPSIEKNVSEIKKTLKYSKWSVGIGILVIFLLLALWVAPYMNVKI